MAFDESKIRSLPVGEDELCECSSVVARWSALHCERTAKWISTFRDSDELRCEVQRLWRRTRLPLRDWASRIHDVGVMCDETMGWVGAAVELRNPRRVVVQQAPLESREAETLAGRCLHRCVEPVIELLSAAPGFVDDAGYAVALREFFVRPMEAWVRQWYGPTWTTEWCRRSDCDLFSEDELCCELAWRPWHSLGNDFVFAGADSSTYLLMEDVTDRGPADTHVSIADQLDALLVNPRRVFSASAPVGTKSISPQRPGRAVREKWKSLSRTGQGVLALRAIYRAMKWRAEDEGWRDVRAVLEEIRSAILSGRAMNPSLVSRAQSLSQIRAIFPNPESNWMFSPTMLLACVDNLAEAAAFPSVLIRYPELRLKPGAKCRPVYEEISADMERLESLQVSGQNAYAILLNELDGLGA